MANVYELAKAIFKAKSYLASSTTEEKNFALKEIASEIERDKQKIINANIRDVHDAKNKGMKSSLIDRLSLDYRRIDSMVDSVLKLVELKDPVGKIDTGWVLPNGLKINRVRVPIGAIGIVYEGRPNVTVEASTIALKSGNSLLLKGSSSAQNTNKALVNAIKRALKRSKIPSEAVELIEDTSHETVTEMIKMDEYLDLIIPRGGKKLIDFVVKNATVPTMETGVGNCHIFVDESANFDMALRIIENAKIQRPGTCNAAEKVLVHKKIARQFEPLLYERLSKQGVELRGCEETLKIIPQMSPASESDWSTEYLDLILGVKIVKDVDEAIEHIRNYGTRHSESIITMNYENALKFTSQIDAAVVYVNASTRFTDGGEFGFGAEMGISTQKIHARGPVGLNELTTYKYVVFGKGQIRT